MCLPVHLLTRRRRLFEAPVTAAYAGGTLLLSGIAGSLVFTSTLPAAHPYLLLQARLGWLARRGDSPVLRGVWLVAVGVLTLGLGLAVASRFES